MNDYKELIVKCEEWLAITKRLKADDLTQHIEMCADAIEHLYEEYKILEWQNHLERCEHQNTKDNRDEIAKNLEDILCDYADVINENYDLKHKCDECGIKTSNCIVKLQEQLAKVAKERDAAVGDLKSVLASECGLNQCRYCKYQEDDYQCHHDCIPYSEKWGWEWRGVQEDNDEID